MNAIATSQATLDSLEATWHATADLCRELTAEQWSLPTGCPGWTVHNLLAHIAGTERLLSGDALPGEPIHAPHVRNELGAINEAWVEHYRALGDTAMLAEFNQVTERRMSELRSWSAEQLDEVTLTPMGMRPWRDFLEIRLIDCFAHEQDIRQALGTAWRLNDEVAEFVIAGALRAMPKQVVKGAGAAEGQSVSFVLPERNLVTTVITRDGRGVVDNEVQPTVMLSMSAITLLRLAWGRVDANVADVDMVGDRELGKRVVQNMTFMF